MTSARLQLRDLMVHAVLGGIGLILVARLFQLQVIQHQDLASTARRQQISEEIIPARPGDIVDRKGRLLAATITVPSLWLDPSQVDDAHTLAEEISEICTIDPQQLMRRIEAARDKRFIWVKRQLTDEEYLSLQQLKRPVLGFRQEFQRFYPQAGVAAHVLGLRNIDNVGRGGVEQSFDHLLKGEPGVRRFVRDARGYVLDVLEEVTHAPQDGATIILTLDVVLQLTVEQRLDQLMAEHRPQGACAIVLDPHTGEVLAMASRPTFDPQQLSAVSPAAWKNLAISSVYEPGSTFKPLVVGYALDRGQLSPQETFDCEYGAYQMGPRLLHDHHPYGNLSLTDVLVKSSNIGMAKIGERLGNGALYHLIEEYGFGRKTGIELPGEVAGLLRPLKDWNIYSTGSIPMGQELATTPLQMIAAHAVLANGGEHVSPHLLLSTDDRERVPQHVVVKRILSETATRQTIECMVEVVKRGTGQRAARPGWNLFGKTGTAQIYDPTIGRYSNSRSVCSFICGAPAEDPRLLVLVCVNEPNGINPGGGTVAAPAAADMLVRCLQLTGESPPWRAADASPLSPKPSSLTH